MLVIALALAGCSSIGSSSSLTDHEWSLEMVGGVPALENVFVTVTFADDGQLFGSGGCNRIAGTWESGADDSLAILLGPQTLIACGEPIADQEQRFISALEKTTSFELDEDALTLRDEAGNESATLTKLTPAELIGTQWEVTSINDGQTSVVGVISGTTITAVFGDDGRVTGNAGCNTYIATFSTDNSTITIDPVATTRMACGQSIMDQEHAFITALERSATYELGATMLYLRANDGSLLVSYKVVD